MRIFTSENLGYKAGTMRRGIISFMMVLFSCVIWGQEIDSLSLETHCSSIEERKLYNLIIEYRTKHNLSVIPFSKSLSYVARVHAMDLQLNRPDFGDCNPHSWSDKGKWKPCCYATDKNRLACMNQKPSELSGYKFKAFEMVYSGNEGASAMEAFELWAQIALTNDYILNTGKWTKEWKAIGIGIYGDYACMWFGEGIDKEGNFRDCTSDTLAYDSAILIVEVPIEKDTVLPQYYIIISSINTLEKANLEIKKLHESGFLGAVAIPNGQKIRIAIAGYKDEASAQNQLSEFKIRYPDAWILKPQ